MKKILILLLLVGVFSLQSRLLSQSFQNTSLVFKSNLNLLPDVMNNVNVLESDGNGSFNNVSYNLDSFPSFPNWPKAVSGTSFEGGIYCNMDSDAALEIVYAFGNTVYAWKMDGSNVPGWPKTLSYFVQGAPAFGDIDGDGQGEIVVGTASGSSNGLIYAFKRDGSTVPGFPINHGYTTRTIVLGDLDNNGRMEIITNKRLSNSGEVWVYRGDGTVYPGWPKTINHVPASSCAVGDITGDGIPEIIAESYNSLYAYDRNGNILPGFPFTMPNGDNNSYSSPVLADLDGDGKREIIFGTHRLSDGRGFVYALKFDGSIMPGWSSRQVNYWIYGPPAVGFINNDNILDIAIGDQVLSGSPVDYLYAWDKNGTPLPGFPVGPINAINDQVVLADINNDNMTELIVDDNTTSQSGTGQYLAYHNDGTPVSGWPIITQGTTFFNMPCLLDINNNGILDMVGAATVGTTNANVYLWNTGAVYNPSKIYIPMWQYNTRHNGVFGDTDPLGINPVSSEIPAKFKLYQNYPNPFNPSTKIKFDIASFTKGRLVNLTIYDMLGREVATLINSELNPGTYEINWNASNFSTGVYLYKIIAGDWTDIKKMVLVK
jgi:hypothetical protein